MQIEPLMRELAQALGGDSKHKGDFWVLEVPVTAKEKQILFFRLNKFSSELHGNENLLVLFTIIDSFKKSHCSASHELLEKLLRANVDLRFSRIALMGDRIALLAAASEAFPVDVVLEMVHEVAYAGSKLTKEVTLN